ncbi:MAG: elongation factor Ts [Candidatus Niyogibacteria bacterium]|nr:elongation factor Ts [Candidatus Niyogibacteria bacterium]
MSNQEAIKKLRSFCGASITACKKALDETGGDFEKALEILKKQGAEIAEKKSARETRAGVVDAYIHQDRRLGAVVVLKSETDFVSRGEEFVSFAHELAMHVAAMNPKDTEELLGQPFVKDQSKTIKECLQEKIAKFGENIEVANFSRFEL